ncbi:ATP-binding protein [Aliiroseovarius sp. YM-037]|uniref:ATP-binding protein n=1 Tax=Aliiroseovarius sp. YM-037 TaxID=3341728 RepID=UPI003A811D64
MSRSLRQRAIMGGAAWAILIVVIGTAALLYLLERQADRRFDNALLSRHLQVVVAVANSDGHPDQLAALLTDPAYARPYSGRYWQVSGGDQGAVASRSLFDTLLDVPDDPPSTQTIWTGEGPNGAIRGVHQLVRLDDGRERVVTVADSLTALTAERRRIRQSLLATFGLVGVLGIAGAILLTSAALRPLRKLREDVTHRWDSPEKLNPDSYPAEVAPLVTDIDTLLERNREIIDRSRRQAADLAHALKTPSAILRNEIESACGRGFETPAAIDALNRIDAQINRSLARIRAGNHDPVRGQHTAVRTSVDRLLRLFKSVPASAHIDFRVEVADSAMVAMDQHDLEEVLGNLLENATKWAKGRVSITATTSGDSTDIVIEDDGPGIPDDARREALRTGGRLDTSKPGSGLGLAIATDLLDAYGGSVSLSTSERLGGLKVQVSPPSGGRLVLHHE